MTGQSLIGLYKSELVHRRGPWHGLDQVELIALGRLVQPRRLHCACGDVPPAGFEEQYYRHSKGLEIVEAEQLSLH